MKTFPRERSESEALTVQSWPLVSAICPTRNRPAFLRKAIACLQVQTYPNLELVIVADGDDVQTTVSNSLWLDVVNPRHAVRYIYLREQMTIGGKRNLACSRSRGEIICHFDDDDWSHPERIASQVQALRVSGKQVTGYHRMIFVDPSGSRYQFDGSKWNVCGTSLCYRRDWWGGHRFPPQSVQEDAVFSNLAHRMGVLHSCDAEGMMTATIHPGNTSPRNLNLGMYEAL